MGKKMQFKSIRTRLIFWFMMVALLPLIAVHGVIYMQQAVTIKAIESGKLIAVRDYKAREINAWLDDRIANVKIMADDCSIKDLKNVFEKQEWRQDNIDKIRDRLNYYVRNYKNFSEIFIVNPASGKIEISTNKLYEKTDCSKNPYFTEPMRTGEIYIKDVYYSKNLNEPAMTFSIPVRCLAHENDHITAILVVRINLKQSLFDILLDNISMGDTGETLIVNKNAIAINQLRWNKNTPPLTLKIEAKPAIKASQGNTGIIEALDYKGVKVLAAYCPVARTGWGFVAKQDLEEIYAPVKSIFWNLLISLLTSTFIVYVIAFFTAKNITGPVLAMTKVAKKLQGGDSSARNSVLRWDEVGYLAAAFNRMADSMMSQTDIKQAGADITETMMAAVELKNFAMELIKQLIKTTGSNLGAFYLATEDETGFEHYTSIGLDFKLLTPFNAAKLEGEFGKVLATRKISRISNITDDTVFTFKTFAGTALPREIITIPLIVNEKIKGIVSLASLSEYSKESIEILNRTWTVMNTAFSNLLANEETKRLAGELDVQNQELQAQAEELQSQTEELRAQSEELQAQNEELEVQRKEVEEANRLKSEFLSNMSHELRTPLNSVLALSRVLITQTQQKLSAKEVNYLEIIERNGRELLALINDILDLAKIEAGWVDVRIKNFLPGPSIEIVIENFKQIAHEKGIGLGQNIPDNLPQIESDEAKVHQVLQNIIGNGVKFTKKGSVTVSAYNDAQNVYIKVTDTGIGIPEEHLPYIFDEFRQVDGTSARSYKGTGLGLAIASKTAKLLGGAVAVESVLGKGSTFTVQLPIEWRGTALVRGQVSVTPPPDSTETEKETILIVDDDPNVAGMISEWKKGKKILLVEDNEITIIQVKRLLEAEGYKVDVARGGKEALNRLKHKIPDGIILDLMMPKVDGFKVLEKIRGAEATASIPVLVLTAKDLTPDDFIKLSVNNVDYLIHKGDVDQSSLLLKTKLMLGEKLRAIAGVFAEKRKITPEIAKTMPTILVVEDNPDNMITIKALLKDRYKILEATDGEQGLKAALTELPDLVLLDIALPKMDGIEVVGKIRDDKAAGSIPVIALTARAMKGDRKRIIEAGCDDYISKPIDAETILSKIKKWLKGCGNK